MKSFFKSFRARYAFYFGGDQPPVSWLERIRSVFGAFVGLMLVIAAAKYLGELSSIDEWLMASLGASALLVFALPGSPMAQPCGHCRQYTFCLGGGYLCKVGYQPLLALPLAASVSILGMFILRCLHPPAAAVALIAVLGHITHYRYGLFPVMVDSILLVIAGAVYSNLTGKAYPNKPPK